MTAQEQIERARRARELMNDPLLTEVLEEVRQEFIQQSLDGENVATREAARSTVIGLAAIAAKFDEIVGDGEHARSVAGTMDKGTRRR
jgi:hypothetical protein